MTAGRPLPHDWFPLGVPDNVVLGPHTYLHSSFAFHHYRSRRQVGVRVGAHTTMYDPTSFALGPDADVVIGDYCLLYGPTFAVRSRVVVGDCVLFSGEVYVADHASPVPPLDVSYEDDQDVSPAGEASITIDDDCWLGVRSVALAGAHLGRGAIVGAGAVVDTNVPPYAVVAGNPARIVGYAEPSPTRPTSDTRQGL